MKKVCVHLAEGFEEIEALTVVDVLRRGEIEVVTVSMTKEKEVKGSHNIVVIADKLFEEVTYEEMDMLILPGGMPGSANLAEHAKLREKISEFMEKDKYLAAICAAPMVFGRMGILKNKKAVCYPGYEKDLLDAEVLKEKVMQDKNIITSRGVGTALEFSLKLVEILKDRETALKLQQGMLIV